VTCKSPYLWEPNMAENVERGSGPCVAPSITQKAPIIKAESSSRRPSHHHIFFRGGKIEEKPVHPPRSPPILFTATDVRGRRRARTHPTWTCAFTRRSHTARRVGFGAGGPHTLGGEANSWPRIALRPLTRTPAGRPEPVSPGKVNHSREAVC
jgi:hypothetical protein